MEDAEAADVELEATGVDVEDEEEVTVVGAVEDEVDELLGPAVDEVVTVGLAVLVVMLVVEAVVGVEVVVEVRDVVAVEELVVLVVVDVVDVVVDVDVADVDVVLLVVEEVEVVVEVVTVEVVVEVEVVVWPVGTARTLEEPAFATYRSPLDPSKAICCAPKGFSSDPTVKLATTEFPTTSQTLPELPARFASAT